MDNNTLDVELLIDCVKSRSALWNPSDENYKNRNKKKEGWSEVCQIFHPDFEEKPDIVKNKICKYENSLFRLVQSYIYRYIFIFSSSEKHYFIDSY